MLKKILYAIVIIAIIVVLAIMWTDGNNKKGEMQLENQTSTTKDDNIPPTDTGVSISNELDTIDLNSGIDTDISSMDADIKSL